MSKLELIKERPLQRPSFLSLCSQWKGTVPSLFPGGPGFEKMGESRLIVEELLTICLQRVMVEESARITEQGETSCGLTLGLWVIIWSLPAPRFCIHLFQRWLKWWRAMRQSGNNGCIRRWNWRNTKSYWSSLTWPKLPWRSSWNMLATSWTWRWRNATRLKEITSTWWVDGPPGSVGSGLGPGPGDWPPICSQQRQMQLMCDILVHDSKSSACLNDEQKSLLAAFEQRGANVTAQRSSKR